MNLPVSSRRALPLTTLGDEEAGGGAEGSPRLCQLPPWPAAGQSDMGRTPRVGRNPGSVMELMVLSAYREPSPFAWPAQALGPVAAVGLHFILPRGIAIAIPVALLCVALRCVALHCGSPERALDPSLGRARILSGRLGRWTHPRRSPAPAPALAVLQV